MTEFLDELARSLARPMSRPRALRLIGGALVSVAVPGFATTRGARGASSFHRCKADGGLLCECNCKGDICQRICCIPKEDYECNCGTVEEGAGCRPKPKKVCGPDITDALIDALSRVKSTFAGWSTAKRYLACTNLVTLPGAAVSWDVRELGPGGRGALSKQYPGCGTCGNSVQVGRDCHYSGSVNYVAYGVMMRLCHDYLSKEDSSIADWFTAQEMLELIYIHKNQSGTQAANFQASNEWANAGYNNSGSLRPTPPGDRKECKERCTKAYSGPGLTVNWLPFVIGPNG